MCIRWSCCYAVIALNANTHSYISASTRTHVVREWEECGEWRVGGSEMEGLSDKVTAVVGWAPHKLLIDIQ